MTYPTRRARIEAEKAEKLALRSKRNKRFTLGVAGLATAASASVFGMAPANAAIDDAPAPVASNTSASNTSEAAAGSYTVKSGDTLSKIANAQGVSLNALMSANNLSASSIIYPGDVLKLPGSSSSATPASQSSSTDSNATQSSSTDSNATQSGSAQTETSSDATFTSVKTASATGAKATAIDKALDIVNSGASYVWGGNGPSGYDCSGLTKTAFAAAGIDIPRTSAAQFSAAKSHVSL
ncbi:MAG TPA: LysM peptidoglycan-binding domain-containing protein, partial [Enteractinococcus sp.]